MPDITFNRILHVNFPNKDLSEYDPHVESGTASLSEILISSTNIKFGEYNSNKFEVTMYDLPDVSGEKIEVYIEDYDTTEAIYHNVPIFVGYVDSCKLDNLGYYRQVIAYDELALKRNNSVKEWWNNFWLTGTNAQGATLATLRNSVCDYVGLNYTSGSYFNDSLIIKPVVMTVGALQFANLLQSICELQCIMPNMNRNGYLEFIQLDNNATHNVINYYEHSNSEFENYTTSKINQLVIAQNSAELFNANIGEELEPISNIYTITDNLLLQSFTETELFNFGYAYLNRLRFVPRYTPASVKMIVSDLNIKLGNLITTEKGNIFAFKNELSGSLLVEQSIISTGDIRYPETTETNLSESVYISEQIKSAMAEVSEEIDDTAQTLLDTIQDVSEQITGNAGGYVVIHDTDADDQPDEILIMNTDDIATAENVWRWNKNGLGYSSTGYDGAYGTAITADGKIVADYIRAGKLNADILKTGVIRGQQGNSYWNLVTGELHIEGEHTEDKSRVFISEPTTPYYMGDLWVTGQISGSGIAGYAIAGEAIVGDDSVPSEGGKIMACTYSRTSGDFNEDDWELITNYVDTSELDILKQRVTNAEFNISQQNAKIDLKASATEVTDLGDRVTSAELSISGLDGEISSKVSQTDYNGATIASLINQSASTVLIQAEHINLNGKVTMTALASDVTTNISNAQDTADSAVNAANNAQNTANNANSQEQLIYISKRSGTTNVDGTNSWVTNTTGNQNTWTIKRPVYNSSYPVLFVATQRRTVGGTVTCTTPQIDQTTTVIDGGHITTGTIDAGRIAANSITVNKLSGSISNSGWVLNLTNGTFTIGNISADNIRGGSISANLIYGGTLTMGGSNNSKGTIYVQNSSSMNTVCLDKDGLGFFNSTGSWSGDIVTREISGGRTELVANLYSVCDAFSIKSSSYTQPLYVFDRDYSRGFSLYNNSYKKLNLCPTTDGNVFAVYNSSGSTVARIMGDGYTEVLRLVQTSDINAKEQIEDINQIDAEKFILSLQPKKFKLKESDGIHHGFIAQDVEQIADWDIISENESGRKALAYTEIIADLVATVQSLNVRINELEKELKDGRQDG